MTRTAAGAAWQRARPGVAAVLAAWLGLVLNGPAFAQPSEGSQPAGLQSLPRGGPANTTVVPRSGADIKGNANLGEVTLVALLTDEGQRIEQGLVWRAFQEQTGTASARPKIVGTWREASPTVKLPPGEYVVNVAFGRAHITRRISVEAGVSTQAPFVLNAGGLRVSAVIGSGEAAPERSVSYDIFTGDTDQLGNRTKVVGGMRPGVIVRLNAGVYHVVSTYGDANATVESDVNVEAGKLTEASISHTGARVTFKLVMRAGGEAQAGAQWAIANSDGETVKESVGALPTHILAPGAYVVTARHSGRSFRREFTVQAGDTAQVEVVMR